MKLYASFTYALMYLDQKQCTRGNSNLSHEYTTELLITETDTKHPLHEKYFFFLISRRSFGNHSLSICEYIQHGFERTLYLYT